MDWAAAPDLWHARWLFQRGLALVYVLGFAAWVHQYRPLLSAEGLLPLREFTAQVDWRQAPSLFQWRDDDRVVLACGWAGLALALAALVGVVDAGPIWMSMLSWAVLWALYLSMVNVGRQWYAFGWESLLCEAGFLAIWLGPHDVTPSLATLLLVRWLLLRVEVGAGLIKLRGDPCWRDLTCLQHHHETQPMPNRASWFFHHLPRWAHRVEVGANHVTQLVVPFLLFLPQPIASIAAGIVIVTQGWLVLSGNFAWLNLLTMLLATTALDGRWLGDVLPADRPAELVEQPTWFVALAVAVVVLVVVRSVPVVRNLVSPAQSMNRSFDPLRLVNTYGAFGSVTRERYELVLEGTADLRVGPDTVWHAYRVPGTPSDVSRPPPQVAPYHLRLGWLLWFAAMHRGPTPRHRWLLRLCGAVLEGNEVVRRALADDPFPDEPPRHVRVRRYHYRFTTPAERRATGDWWVRRSQPDWLPPVGRGDIARLRR